MWSKSVEIMNVWDALKTSSATEQPKKKISFISKILNWFA